MSARRRRDTPPPRTGGTERETLLGFLDYLRESAVGKVEGAPEPGVREPGVASGTNLLGLLTHLTAVERYTFLGDEVSDWARTFHAADDDTVASVITGYRAAVREANEAIAACDDLTEPTRMRPGRGRSAPSMRWALTHMIEETGRHAGHLDILRERLDGAIGR